MLWKKLTEKCYRINLIRREVWGIMGIMCICLRMLRMVWLVWWLRRIKDNTIHSVKRLNKENIIVLTVILILILILI